MSAPHPMLAAGLQHQAQGQWYQAERCYRAALEQVPVQAQLQLGRLRYERGDHDRAWDHFQAALDLEPRCLPAWVMLAQLALHAREGPLALDYVGHALSVAPSQLRLWQDLAQEARELGDWATAAAAYGRWLEAFPEDAEVWLQQAQAYQRMYWTSHEITCLERALALRPHDARLLRTLAMTRFFRGDWEASAAHFARVLSADALAGEPEAVRDAIQAQRRIFELDYQRFLFSDPEVDDEGLFAWIRHCHALEPAERPRRTSRRPGPLRVGYLSGEFGSFASALLVWPLYLHHDPEIELFFYDDTAPEDRGEDHRPRRGTWRQVQALGDTELALQIRADGIDVLTDVTGITHQRRHGLYALHPAPVQVSGLGFVFSSALACMDYCITDKVLCPPPVEALYPEKAVHLASAFHWQACEPFALTDPPCLRNGFITLGAAHTLNRLNPVVIALWSELLRRIPDSRLFLKTHVLADPQTQDIVRARFAAHGIDPARLRLEGPGTDFHVSYFYPQIDIALDPWPYSGGVTTSEALWMGVPVAVMDKPELRSRALSVSILTTLGLQDWLAHSEVEYLERVLAWAADRDFLVTQRYQLRERLLASTICDGPGFARELETAYRAMVRESLGGDED